MKTEMTQRVQLPEISCYCDYSSGNYGLNAVRVDLPNISVWFSYKTPVAFRTTGETVCRENTWGPTTGKHLNAIEPDKSKRVDSETFEKLFAEATGQQ